MKRAAAEWMVIGRIAGAFGVRGEAKVDPQTDFPERFGQIDRLFLGAEHRPVRVESSRRHKGQILLKLEGIETPEAVAALRGWDVMVPREDAVPLPEGHYYLDEIVGMEVVTVGGRSIGKVSDVFRTGSNDVYVVGRGAGEILIPAIRDAVTDVDIPGGRITVEEWVLEPAD